MQIIISINNNNNNSLFDLLKYLPDYYSYFWQGFPDTTRKGTTRLMGADL